MLSFVRRLFVNDIAMDLGTANTLMFMPKRGLIVNEPSVVALDARSGSILAVGGEAKAYLGRTPQNIRTVRPLKEGVIADFDITREMIAYFVRKALNRFHIFKPSMAICVPSCITQVEKKAVIDSARLAGAGRIRLIEEPMAAAIGARLPVHEPTGSMVLDIGGGTSEVAVISMSAPAVSQSVRLAGDAMNEAIQRYIHDVFRTEIGIISAENLKIKIGTAIPLKEEKSEEVMGKDVLNGIPCTVTVSSGHIREALREVLTAMANVVCRALEKTPPELAADIYSRGMLLSGGGSILYGLDHFLAQQAHIAVTLDSAPLTTVLRGTAIAMMDEDPSHSIFIN